MKKQSVLLDYVNKNKKTFIIIITLFFLGIVSGIIFINNVNSSQISEINNYVSELVNNIKKFENIDKTEILFQSIKQNTLFLLLIWFLGCTIIGSFFIYIAIIYRGFSLGYTIAAVIASLGAKSGTIFVLSSLLLQNIIFLPAVFILAESGIKLYNGITKNCINLKSEVIRHTAIMLISMFLALIASFTEVYISTNLLIFLKDFI